MVACDLCRQRPQRADVDRKAADVQEYRNVKILNDRQLPWDKAS